jgi:NADPH-dependent 2,4-dienoyl-CoA reductase/sulfur reductase-like enzyme
MKRSHAEILDPSPTVSNEATAKGLRSNGKVKSSPATATTMNGASKNDIRHVTVVGAGPAGLMLAYVVEKTRGYYC